MGDIFYCQICELNIDHKYLVLITTFPLISVILTDMNLKAVLVFVLFATELTVDSRGGHVFTDDVTNQIFLAATGLPADTTGQVGALVYHEGEHPVVMAEIYTIKILNSLFQCCGNVCIAHHMHH